MTTGTSDLVRTLCEAFGITPVEHDKIPYGSGLINKTFLLKDRKSVV